MQSKKKKRGGVVPHTAGIESVEVPAKNSVHIKDWHGFTGRLGKVLDRDVN